MAQQVYEVSFRGAASETLAGAFVDCEVSVEHDVTTLRTAVPDQAALQGLIARIHGLGLELLDVHRVPGPEGAGHDPGAAGA